MIGSNVPMPYQNPTGTNNGSGINNTLMPLQGAYGGGGSPIGSGSFGNSNGSPFQSVYTPTPQSSMNAAPMTANATGSSVPTPTTGMSVMPPPLTQPVISSTSPATTPTAASTSAVSALDIGASPGSSGLYGSLTSTYGEGEGDALANFLASGAGYNPAVAQALIAQMQPQIQEGQNNILQSFGDAGARYSSAAGIGLANYNNQATLDENSILANQYQQSVQNYMTTLTGTESAVAQNQSSGIFGDLEDIGQLAEGVGGALTGIDAITGNSSSTGNNSIPNPTTANINTAMADEAQIQAAQDQQSLNPQVNFGNSSSNPW